MLRRASVTCAFFCTFAQIQAQHRVDPRNMYERVVAAVPLIGKGTIADPKRPMYTPAPSPTEVASRSGILAYQCQQSDNGLLALCEFIAADRNALKPILNDPHIKSFLKGRDKREDIEAEFRKYKKDFDISTFGVRMP